MIDSVAGGHPPLQSGFCGCVVMFGWNVDAGLIVEFRRCG